MFYRKNLYSWESALRIVSGLAVAALGYWALHDPTWVGAAVATGIGWAATGVAGWCPMCAMVGRKINAPAQMS